MPQPGAQSHTPSQSTFLLILLSFTGPGGACRLLDLSLVNLMFGAPGHDRGVGDDAVLNKLKRTPLLAMGSGALCCGTTRSWKYMALNMLSATCIARIESGTLLFPAARQHSIKGAPAGQGESSRREGSVGERIVHAQDSIRPGEAHS